MQQVSNLVAGALAANRAAPQQKPAGANRLDPDAVEIVNRLFVELVGIFTAWKYAWPNDSALAAAKRNWVQTFMQEGVRDAEQIRRGLAGCRSLKSPYPVTAMAFVELCRPAPQELGCPSVERAYSQACALAHPAANRDGAHPAVWHAATEVGLSELASKPADKTKPVFEQAYGKALEMLARGESLRQPAPALPKQVFVRAAPEVAAAHMAKIRELLRTA